MENYEPNPAVEPMEIEGANHAGDQRMKQHATRGADSGRKKLIAAAVLALVVLIAIIVGVVVAVTGGDDGPGAPVLINEPGEVGAGGALIASSEPGQLRLLTKLPINGDATWPIPCARSYEGHPWEVVRPREGLPKDLVQLKSCNSQGLCEFKVPSSPGFKYQYQLVNVTEPDAAAKAAHFLMQATFGPTKATIDAFGDEAQWVQDQFALAPTLHREYYRRRASPRQEVVSWSSKPRLACEAGARWNGIAIRADDIGQTITFTTQGGVNVVLVGGVLRSEVELTDMRPWGLGAPQSSPGPTDNCNSCQDGALVVNTDYTVCAVDEWRMGVVTIAPSCENLANKVEVFNVGIKFDTLAYPTTDRYGKAIQVLDLPLSGATMATLTPTIYNEYALVVESWQTSCPFSLAEQSLTSTTLKYDGQYYRYDPRTLLLANTLDDPLVPESAAQSGVQRSCPALSPSAPKTFMNEDNGGCVISNACSPDRFGTQTFTLNDATLAEFFFAGNNFVYAIDDLPRDTQENPCTTPQVRWRKVVGACTETGGLSAGTKDILRASIRATTDTNPNVRDVELTAACSDNAQGAIVDVDGTCWEHVNKDLLNVYDFTRWAEKHDGNNDALGFYPIRQFAYNGDSRLYYPTVPNHPLSRWQGMNAKGEPFGRLGDTISFADLPQRVQSQGLADALGVDISPETAFGTVEVCGSPGEVANDPTLGSRFYWTHEYWTANPKIPQQELLGNNRRNVEDQRHTVHATIAHRAPDQLRQRVSWALAQTFVIGDLGNGDISRMGEIWAHYYDIFVRHAFGSYRDIMREVSYNPMMATYLTYHESASWSSKGAVPDENYARELVQLFSLGLFSMHKNGTEIVDSKGVKIPTYTNDNIVEMARVWTGFHRRDVRGNLEQKPDGDVNYIDPMYVDAEDRDAFPKIDLYAGHVGDTYPLCADMPSKPYLKAGAKYRYLGDSGHPVMNYGRDIFDFTSATAPANEPLFTPNPSTSELYAALCNPAAGGECRFQSTVTLASDLTCDGDECDIPTAAAIRIQANGNNYYYEYVAEPCVRLAFQGAEDGVYIENVNSNGGFGGENSAVVERLCVDKRDRVGSPGCCSATSINCLEYRCKRVEERMNLAEAIERCSEVPTPAPDSTPEPGVGDWAIWPAEYRQSVQACPAGAAVPTKEECYAAAIAAITRTAEPWVVRPGNNRVSERNSATQPKGCFLSSSNSVLFNTHPTGAPSRSFRMICGGDVDGAADYSASSPVLCARKNSVCSNNVGNEDRHCKTNYIGNRDISSNRYFWTTTPCAMKAQVGQDGRVSLVVKSNEERRVGVNSYNWFGVRWDKSGAFPLASNNCGAASNACTVVASSFGDTCLCDVEVTKTAVFTDLEAMPDQAAVEDALKIGAMAPSSFPAGTYTLCTAAECTEQAGVDVYTKGSAGAPVLDKEAIFKIKVNSTNANNGRTLYLGNWRSTVILGDGNEFSFRNPPTFMTLSEPSQRDALHETEALLDHIFYHHNVPPFVAKMLTQKLVTSNPSPRYVEAVADAFISGEYDGVTYSGQYGDLRAAVAATVLDREARSHSLAYDPSHGQLREPLLKLMHTLRSMEFKAQDDSEMILNGLITKLGQQVFMSPTVFNFFQPSYSPEGVAADTGLVAPEAQLGILPYIIGYFDGMHSLVFDGLSSCEGGFGRKCTRGVANPKPWGSRSVNDGYLDYTPTDATSAEAVVDELSLLLTAGRLEAHARDVVLEEYNHALNNSLCPVDRSADFCGRLEPGDELNPGEYIVNSAGETLCVTYGGFVIHMDTQGREVWSNDWIMRDSFGEGFPLEYLNDNSGQLRQSGRINRDGVRRTKWSSTKTGAGQYKALHSFLNGPCYLLNQASSERQATYGYSTHGPEATIDTCAAASTCGQSVPQPPGLDDPVRAATAAQHAVRVAQNLILQSANFAVTNNAGFTAEGAGEPAPPRDQSGNDYKALVVFYMGGGADTFNMLIPHSQCDDRDVAQQYVDTRTSAGIPLNTLLQIDVPAGTQPCDKMGVHPSLGKLQELWNDGDLSFTANIGPLIEPLTKQQYKDKEGQIPAGIFSHNLQTQSAKTLFPQSSTGETGVVGRVFKAFVDQANAAGSTPLKGSAYSITSDGEMFRGSPSQMVLLDSTQGMLTFEGSETARQASDSAQTTQTLDAMERMAGKKAKSVFAHTHNSALRSALSESERVSELLKDAALTQDWEAAASAAFDGRGERFVGQLEQVANVIAQREAFKAERDVFYIELGGWDMHNEVILDIEARFTDVNAGISAFVAEMKGLGVWDNVVLQSMSEFGRTMTSNGRGTDHAWAGNHFTLGGKVKGGVIHGDFPEVRPDGPNSISGTGQMLPTSPWESVWKPLVQWLGVNDNQLNNVLPNLDAFPADILRDKADMFEP